MGVVGIDHVALPSWHPEAMMAFYRALGFIVPEEQRWSAADRGILTIVCGDQKINVHPPELWQDSSFTLRGHVARPGCGDLCFAWAGGLDELLQTLRDARASIELGPEERIGGRNNGRDRGMSVYTRDPDDNLVEFIVYDR